MKLDQIRVAITKEKGYTKNIFIVYLEDIEVNVKIRLTREFFFSLIAWRSPCYISSRIRYSLHNVTTVVRDSGTTSRSH